MIVVQIDEAEIRALVPWLKAVALTALLAAGAMALFVATYIAGLILG